MDELKIRDKKTGEVFTIREKEANQESASLGQVANEASQSLARGFYKGSSDLAGNLDTASKVMSQATNTEPGGAFGNIQSKMSEIAGTFPEPQSQIMNQNLVDVGPVKFNSNQALETVGRAIPATAEFLAVKGMIPALSVGQKALSTSMGNTPRAIRTSMALTDATAFGVQSAVNEYRASGMETKSIVPGLVSGSTLGLAFPLGAEGIRITKNMGVNAGKAFIEFVTDNPKLAEDFTKNMWKYNTNAFGKVKNPQEITILNNQKLSQLKSETSKAEFELVGKQQQEKHVLDSSLNEVMTETKELNRITKEAATEGRTAKLSQSIESGKTTLAKAKESVDTNLYGHFTHAVEYLQTKRDALGTSVKEAVKNVVNKDPGALVKRQPLLKQFETVLNENDFNIADGVVQAKAAGGLEPQTTTILQGLYDDIIGHLDNPNTPVGVPLDYLQNLKERIQGVAYAGQSNHSTRVLKQLSGALKPENFMDDIIGRNVDTELSQLKAANTDFFKFSKNSDEAMELLTSTDAAGKPMADTKRVLNAVRSGDRKTMAQLMKADGALPEALKIRPQMDKTVRAMSEAETTYASKIKHTRRVLSHEKNELNRKIRTKESEIRQADNETKFNKSKSLRNQLNEFKIKEDARISSIENLMKEEEEFITQQQSLRKIFASGRAGGAQVGAGMGAIAGGVRAGVANDVTTGILSGLSGTASAMLSPIVASNLVKGSSLLGKATGVVTKPTLSTLRAALESRLIKASLAQDTNK